jgi:hypothetical protein
VGSWSDGRTSFHFSIADKPTSVPLPNQHSGTISLTMSVKQLLFGLGLLIYTLSLLLFATGDHKGVLGRLKGFECAYLAIASALDSPFSAGSGVYPPVILYLSISMSGLINPVFLVYAALASLTRKPRIVRVLRLVLLSMIPFCWVVFHFLEVYPREGHVLWVIGMLFVLFSSWTQESDPLPRRTAS